MKYYSRTIGGFAVLFTCCSVAALLTNAVAAQVRLRHERLAAETASARQQAAFRRHQLARLQQAMIPAREFLEVWRPHTQLAEKSAAEKIRSDIEAVAQRQLGLVTDNAITPQPDRYLAQGNIVRVQRVTLRASGKDLAVLLAWLGRVEERYPAALLEHCEFSSNVGGNTGLTLRLVQPLQDPTPRRVPATPPGDVPALTESIASVPWASYLPSRVKASVAVGVQRNPLQPAIAAESRSGMLVRPESDDITPKLEAALEGRLRSVIRGAAPLVVIDGRIFRVGDEIVLGPNREKPVPDAKTRLKQIGDERLLFHVSGGTSDRALQCEVVLTLPAFLKAR